MAAAQIHLDSDGKTLTLLGRGIHVAATREAFRRAYQEGVDSSDDPGLRHIMLPGNVRATVNKADASRV